MAYEYKEPDVVETHTHREVVVDRDPGGGAGWAVVLVLAVLVVLGLVGYFAFAGDRTDSTQVRVEQPADSGRAQDINIEAPDINVEPPVINTPPPIINNDGGSDSDAGSTSDVTPPDTSSDSGL